MSRREDPEELKKMIRTAQADMNVYQDETVDAVHPEYKRAKEKCQILTEKLKKQVSDEEYREFMGIEEEQEESDEQKETDRDDEPLMDHLSSTQINENRVRGMDTVDDDGVQYCSFFSRWQKYGHDRLYCYCCDGYIDVKTATIEGELVHPDPTAGYFSKQSSDAWDTDGEHDLDYDEEEGWYALYYTYGARQLSPVVVIPEEIVNL